MMPKKKFSKYQMVFLAAALAVCMFGSFSAEAAAPAGGDPAGPEKGQNRPPAGDIQKVAACPFCGMDRQKFAHSRVYIEYDNGSVLGACSIHCAAADLAVNLDKAPQKIWVGDYQTRELIDAEKAAWVIGGDQMGVMTKRAKWAFGTPAAADQFIKTHGGKAAGFEDVMEAAYNDMYQDTKMIRERRAKKRMMQMQHGK